MISLGTLNDAAGVRHAFFTREGGVSGGIFASLNCGYGSGDDRAAIAGNRDIAARPLGPAGTALVTGYHVHGTDRAAVQAGWPAREHTRDAHTSAAQPPGP